ncbi:heavy metal translocating P-type ATPase [Streptomyces venezuelae]|uniref:Heavy metal translocating P-type ATPase n=1 Tax=Streptomyces venezuelae TaxID=54571 RepID=A0A5P2D912_STRVZ|nr:heavy metal translocating P-type ATPase [Streptomyces venezuelae]QES51644.1 heavy metal translocating P-type ATPase [Streptomyces venezuelae]
MTSVSEHARHSTPRDAAACGACATLTEVPARRTAQQELPAAPRPPNPESEPAAEGRDGHERAELVSALLALAAYLAGLGLRLSGASGPADIVAFGLFLAAYAFGGFFTLREALAAVRRGAFQVDSLMLIAAAGAAAIGKWEEGAVLLVLFSLGHALEGYALGRARRSVEALGELAPRTAVLLRDGETSEVPVGTLAVGDTVRVRPHTRVPADGFLLAGTGSIDQSALTGESVPADKHPVADPAAALADPAGADPGSRVFAGTVNGPGSLDIVVTRLAADNTLARVVRMVREAGERTSPTQRFTDRFQKVFVPAVLALVAVLLAAGALSGEPFTDTFYRAMAVLVAASPCALAIATPAAVLSAVGRAARGGVLVKGGAPLEEFGRLRTIAFDKTGTLTEGRPRLTDVVPGQGTSRAELLRTAVAVQQLSDHPLAQAVVRDAPAAGPVAGEATAVRAVVGRGVTGLLDGRPVHIGSLAYADTLDGPPVPAGLRARTGELARDGRTTMLVRHGDRWLGVLGLMDAPRPGAADTIARLRRLGVTRIVMLSGDDPRVAEAVGREVGVDEARGGLMPEGKAAELARLRTDGRTAMIGDGVNDAPAMAGATVGVAMGAAGSAVALETADIALMSDDLRRLPFITGLSRRASRIIRQNLWLSLGIVAVLVPATALGLGIGPAVLVHEGSTVIVVANALRLLRHRDRDGRGRAGGRGRQSLP